MKKILLLLLWSVSLCCAFLSCSKDNEIYDAPISARHTTIMFFPWSDNLKPCFLQNIRDLQKVLSDTYIADERILVCIESSVDYADILEIKANRLDTLYSYHSPDFTSSSGISFFLNKIHALSPSLSYSLIVGSHGTGWLPAGATGRSTVQPLSSPPTRYLGGPSSSHQIDIPVFSRGVQESELQMFEYILFDNCYMANIEAVYDLRDVCRYIVASPSEIMSCGFPYLFCGKYLIGRIDYEQVCNEFYNYYSGYSIPCGTISVIDCAEIDSLSRLARKISALSPQLDTTTAIQSFDGYSPALFFDYGDYVNHLLLPDFIKDEFASQLAKVVPYKRHTECYYSVYFGQKPVRHYSGITTSAPSANIVSEYQKSTNWYFSIKSISP